MRGTRGATRTRGPRLLLPPPSLDLRFAETKSLTDWISGQNLVTFTRASSATGTDASGTLQTATTDVPVFDHNPLTGESLGLRLWESRTNSIRNNTMFGTVAGTPGTAPTNWVVTGTAGTVTRTIVGTGTENGITYLDIRYQFSASGSAFVNFEPSTQIAATSGQSFTLSHFSKIQSGSSANLTFATNVVGYSNAGAALEVNSTAFTPSTSNLISQRYSHTRTLNNASTAFVSGNISITASAAADITLRIGLPQLEQGAFATSVIPTTGATATRSADVASITGANFSSWYNQSEGTVLVTAKTNTGLSWSHGLVSVHDATTANRMFLAVADSVAKDPVNTTVVDGGVNQAGYNAGVYTEKMNAAFGYGVNNFATAGNGSINTDTSGTVPLIDRLFIGTSFVSTTLNGTISRLVYWPQRLPNATLQAITR